MQGTIRPLALKVVVLSHSRPPIQHKTDRATTELQKIVACHQDDCQQASCSLEECSRTWQIRRHVQHRRCREYWRFTRRGMMAQDYQKAHSTGCNTDLALAWKPCTIKNVHSVHTAMFQSARGDKSYSTTRDVRCSVLRNQHCRGLVESNASGQAFQPCWL